MLLKPRSAPRIAPSIQVFARPEGRVGPLLSVRDLSVEFATRRGAVQAVSSVSFDVYPGERLAIVGESGSGKSVMSMSLMQLVTHPGRITAGSAMFDGRDLLALKGKELRAVRGGDLTMVFQDPMTALNPVIRVADQIIPPLRQHLGLAPGAARERAIQVLRQTGIPDPERNIDAYPHELSGGMRQRVLIAMALACEPKLLIADEPTTALDVTVQAQIVSLLKEISQRRNMSVIFVTHDLGLVARFADRVAVMYAGRFVEAGPVREIFSSPQHPYTQGLLASIPAIDGSRTDRLWQIEGTPPDLAKLTPACSYAARCPAANSLCHHVRPLLEHRGAGHEAACWITPPKPGAQPREDPFAY